MASQTLQCELGPENHTRQAEVFRKAQTSFSSVPPPAAGIPVSDQDSGVEDEDLSPRPSPSPHPPVQQTRRVQPSVPELSLLIDSSFTSNHGGWQDPDSSHRPPLPVDGKSAPSTENSSSTPTPPSSAPRPAPPPPHLHSTPTSVLQQLCSCCSAHSYSCSSMFSSLVPRPVHPHSAPSPPLLHHHTPPNSRNHPTTPPPCSHTTPPPPSNNPSSPLSSSCAWVSAPTPPSLVLPPPLPYPCSQPPCVPQCADPPPCPSHPSCVNQHCDQLGGVVPSDTYQLLLHQDQQLRLLQAQVQMLLEAQGRLQSSNQQRDTQTHRSMTSIAVGTGASLFWEDPVQPLPHQDVQAPPPSPPTPPSSSHSPSPSSSLRRSSSHDPSVIRPVGGVEDGDITGPGAPSSPSGQHSGLQSPVLGESVSMYRPADEHQSFYANLMTQLTNRLQDSDSRQEVEESRSAFVVTDRSLSSSSCSSSSSSSRRKKEIPGDDPVVSATLRRLQQFGVNVDEDLTESDRSRVRAVESASTLASINPAAVVSRLSVSDPTVSSLFPGGSVDLSLEANAIALRYLSDSQLSRLYLGGHVSRPDPVSANDSLLSPSNMSLATRMYMRRYGLIEEEDGEDEEEVGEVGPQASTRQPLTEAQNAKVLPQSQLIRDLRPKMQVLAGKGKQNSVVKENCPSRQPTLVRAGSPQTERSVGNILDLSRLRQLPKLF